MTAESKFAITDIAYNDTGRLIVWSKRWPSGLDVTVGDPAANAVDRDLTRWLAEMAAHFEQGGTCNSAKTMQSYSRHLGYASAFLHEHDIITFADAAMDYALAREIVAIRDEASFRSPVARAIVSCAKKAGNADQLLLNGAAGLSRGPVEHREEKAYPATDAETIEEVSREHFVGKVAAARQVLDHLGLPTDLPHPTANDDPGAFAERVLAAATTMDTDVARAVTELGHDNKRFLQHRSRPKDFDTDAFLLVRQGFFTSSLDITAAAVLMMLDGDRGHNDQPVTSLTPADTQIRSNGVTVTVMFKGRHSGEYKVVSNNRQLTRLGGVLATLPALTALTRRRRRRNAETDLERAEAELLFVNEFGNGPARSPGIIRTPDGFSGRVSLRRLRKNAVARQIARGTRPQDLDLAGASHGQVEQYARASLPEEVIDGIAVRNMDAIVATAEAFLDEPDSPLARSEDTDAHAGQGPALDRGVCGCQTGGIDPETDHDCDRGILGCFGCSAARITERNKPGLLAGRRMTEHIRDYGPDEWDNGVAPQLHGFCVAATKKLRSEPTEEQVQAAMPVVLATYYEAR